MRNDFDVVTLTNGIGDDKALGRATPKPWRNGQAPAHLI